MASLISDGSLWGAPTYAYNIPALSMFNSSVYLAGGSASFDALRLGRRRAQPRGRGRGSDDTKEELLSSVCIPLLLCTL